MHQLSYYLRCRVEPSDFTQYKLAVCNVTRQLENTLLQIVQLTTFLFLFFKIINPNWGRENNKYRTRFPLHYRSIYIDDPYRLKIFRRYISPQFLDDARV